MCAPDVWNHFLPIKPLPGGKGLVCVKGPRLCKWVLEERKWELALPKHRLQEIGVLLSSVGKLSSWKCSEMLACSLGCELLYEAFGGLQGEIGMPTPWGQGLNIWFFFPHPI